MRVAGFMDYLVKWRAVLLLVLACGSGAAATAADRVSLEVAIVYNIFLFVQWPGEEAMSPDSPLVLCLDTASSLYTVSRQLEGRTLRRMKLTVQSLEGPANRCKVVYVDTPASQEFALQPAIATGKDPILVIAGSQVEMKTIQPTVQLAESQDRLVFDISQRRARQAGLLISSKLLRLARKVFE